MAKTESKGKAAVSTLLPTVSPEKIIKGMTTIFQGFSIMFDGMAEQMRQMEGLAEQIGNGQQISEEYRDEKSAGKNEASTEAESKSVDTADSVNSEDAPPWEEEDGKKAPAVITVDDLLKVAAQKITMNRQNSPKIKALLTSYGCGAISELPEDRREAFLNDLAQL